MIPSARQPDSARSGPLAPSWTRLLVDTAAAASVGGFFLVCWLLPDFAPIAPVRDAGLAGVFVAFGLSGLALGAVTGRPALGAGLALTGTVGAVMLTVAIVTAPAWAAGLPGGELAAQGALPRALVAALLGGPLSTLCAVGGSARSAR